MQLRSEASLASRFWSVVTFSLALQEQNILADWVVKIEAHLMAPNRPLWNWCTQINWLCWSWKNWLSTTYGAHLFMWMDSRHCTRAVKARAPPRRWHEISMGKSCCLFMTTKVLLSFLWPFLWQAGGEEERCSFLRESLKLLCVWMWASYVELLLVYSKCTLVMMDYRKDQYFCLMWQKKLSRSKSH